MLNSFSSRQSSLDCLPPRKRKCADVKEERMAESIPGQSACPPFQPTLARRLIWRLLPKCTLRWIERNTAAFLPFTQLPLTVTPTDIPKSRQLGGKFPISIETKGTEKKRATGWRWTQSRANFSPAKFPANREKYRELLNSAKTIWR